MTWTDEDTEALRRSDAYASEAGILPSALWKRAAEEIERLQKRLDGMVRGECGTCGYAPCACDQT